MDSFLQLNRDLSIYLLNFFNIVDLLCIVMRLNNYWKTLALQEITRRQTFYPTILDFNQKFEDSTIFFLCKITFEFQNKSKELFFFPKERWLHLFQQQCKEIVFYVVLTEDQNKKQKEEIEQINERYHAIFTKQKEPSEVYFGNKLFETNFAYFYYRSNMNNDRDDSVFKAFAIHLMNRYTKDPSKNIKHFL